MVGAAPPTPQQNRMLQRLDGELLRRGSDSRIARMRREIAVHREGPFLAPHPDRKCAVWCDEGGAGDFVPCSRELRRQPPLKVLRRRDLLSQLAGPLLDGGSMLVLLRLHAPECLRRRTLPAPLHF